MEHIISKSSYIVNKLGPVIQKNKRVLVAAGVIVIATAAAYGMFKAFWEKDPYKEIASKIE